MFSNLEKVKPFEPLEQLAEGNKISQKVDIKDLALGNIVQIKTYAQSPQPYPPDPDSRWSEKLHLEKTLNGRLHFTAVIETRQPVTEVLLLGSMDGGTRQYPGKIESLGESKYRVRFSLPEGSGRGLNLNLKAIVINSQKRWDLEESVVQPTKNTGGAMKLSPAQIHVWSGQDWRQVQTVTEPILNTQDVRFRYIFREPVTDLQQLELNWLVQEEVLKENNSHGSRLRTVHEVFGKDEMIQTRIGGFLIVEVKSRKVSNSQAPREPRNGFVIKDTGLRVMMNTQMADQNYNVFASGPRFGTAGWRSAFQLPPARATTPKPGAAACASVF